MINVNAYFEKKLQEINSDSAQLSAYKATGNTVVIAGPGSGKTTVLTLKVMQLLKDSIYPPRGLACLTYSTEAVREFKNRLGKLGLEKRKNVFLGTVHSFCLTEIIMPFAALYPKYRIPQPVRISSEKEKSRLFSTQQYEGNPQLGDVDKERTRNIKGISRVAIESYDIALKAAISFEELLLDKGYLDFISMVKIAVEIIKNESYVRKAIQARYPWIIVDEYQDLGKPLHELILTLLDMTEINVVSVGDADQSIYDFQGAAPDYLIELSQREDVSCVYLKNNYRSAQTIVDASEHILESSRGYIACGKLHDYRAELQFVECVSGMEEQYKVVVDQVKKYHEKGVPYHEIAVLMGNNAQVDALAKVCAVHNIPTYCSKQKFRTTEFIVWLQSCAGWTLDKNSTSFDDIVMTWRSFVSHKHLIGDPEALALKRLLFKTLTEGVQYKDDMLSWLKHIDSRLDIVSLFQDSDRYPDELDNYEKLLSIDIPQDGTISLDFLARLGIPENQVVLSTRHSSKGLEFDVIIMLGMEKDSFPNYYDNTPRKLSEARRLCFVAVSRARKACILVRSLQLPNKYGRWFAKDPSPFWVELKKFQSMRVESS